MQQQEQLRQRLQRVGVRGRGGGRWRRGGSGGGECGSQRTALGELKEEQLPGHPGLVSHQHSAASAASVAGQRARCSQRLEERAGGGRLVEAVGRQDHVPAAATRELLNRPELAPLQLARRDQPADAVRLGVLSAQLQDPLVEVGRRDGRAKPRRRDGQQPRPTADLQEPAPSPAACQGQLRQVRRQHHCRVPDRCTCRQPRGQAGGGGIDFRIRGRRHRLQLRCW